MTHRMILASADLKTIHAVVVAKRKAPLAQPAEPLIRTQQTGVQDVDGAPVFCEGCGCPLKPCPEWPGPDICETCFFDEVA